VLLRRRHKLWTISSIPLREPGDRGSKAEAEKVDILFRGEKYKINMFGAASETRRQSNRAQPVIFTRNPQPQTAQRELKRDVLYIGAVDLIAAP
jgi:hypothetical protein